MLSGKALRVSIWKHLALNSDDLTPQLKALVDLAEEGKHTHKKTLTKTAIKQVRSKVGTRTGEPKTTAQLPEYVKGSGTAADPHFIEYPRYFIEVISDDADRAKYEDMLKTDLYVMAKARGVHVTTKYTKAKIIAALRAADGE